MNAVAICCNGPIPGCGFPNSAQGIRALGLYQGLSAHGVDCRIVTPADTVHGSMTRWSAPHVRIPEFWHVVPSRDLSQIVNQKYDIAIFLNWSLGANYKKSAHNKVIYDFFSPTIVEHSFIKDRGDLQEKIESKLALLGQADAFVANGTGRAQYALEFLERWGLRKRDTKVVSVPLGVAWQGKTTARAGAARPNEIFVGGFEQIWTKGLSIDDVRALSGRLDVAMHVIGIGEHFHFGRVAQKFVHEELPDQIILHRPGAFGRYCDINRRCDLALDVFSDNRERRLSYSTRSIVSIANGCPVVHMAFTEIGALLAQTPSGWTFDEFDLTKLENVLREVLSDSTKLDAAREETHRFWRRHIDPVRQVQPMLGLLQ